MTTALNARPGSKYRWNQEDSRCFRIWPSGVVYGVILTRRRAEDDGQSIALYSDIKWRHNPYSWRRGRVDVLQRPSVLDIVMRRCGGGNFAGTCSVDVSQHVQSKLDDPGLAPPIDHTGMAGAVAWDVPGNTLPQSRDVRST